MIIHIFASRPLNKDKNYIFIVFLSSLSPILLDSIKKQAKNASKRLKIGKSAELFPHFSQRCEFFPPSPGYRKRELCSPVRYCGSVPICRPSSFSFKYLHLTQLFLILLGSALPPTTQAICRAAWKVISTPAWSR